MPDAPSRRQGATSWRHLLGGGGRIDNLDIDKARRCRCHLLLPPPTEHASGDAIASRDLGYAGTRLGRFGQDITPVCLAEPSPMARARRRNDGTRRRHKRGISRVTKAVTKGVTWGVTKAVTCAAAPVEQLACRRWRFGLELRPPVTECLQRQALRLAILPLIQVTPLPRVMMRPPECIPVSRPRRNIGSHPDLLSFRTTQRSTDRRRLALASVSSLNAYLFSTADSLLSRENTG